MKLCSFLFIVFAQHEIVPFVDRTALVFRWLQVGCGQSIPKSAAVITVLHTSSPDRVVRAAMAQDVRLVEDRS